MSNTTLLDNGGTVVTTQLDSPPATHAMARLFHQDASGSINLLMVDIRRYCMAMIFLDISVKFIIQKVDWDKQVDQVFMEELGKLVEG